jgi:hypothetical protein
MFCSMETIKRKMISRQCRVDCRCQMMLSKTSHRRDTAPGVPAPGAYNGTMARGDVGDTGLLDPKSELLDILCLQRPTLHRVNYLLV